MGNVLDESLFKKDNKKFEIIKDLSKSFTGEYCGTTIVRESIFSIISNYARKNELGLEVLRYPFNDSELWAFTFVKEGTVFLCVNSQLPMCKQIFAAAHELYHIYCFIEDEENSLLINGTLVDSKIVDENGGTKEDLEANAFAGLILTPYIRMIEQINLFGIDKDTIEVDEILLLMDLFAMPYKAIVLRLLEEGIIFDKKAIELLKYDSRYITERIEITGISKQWQRSSEDIISLGSLLNNLSFNTKMDYLTDSRESSDRKYVDELIKEFKVKG